MVAFDTLVKQHHQIYFVIDALDESTDAGLALLWMLFSFKQLNVFVTSRNRHEVHIQNYPFTSINVIYWNATEEDLTLYIEKRVSQSSSLSQLVEDDNCLKNDIIDAVIAGSKGSYVFS